MTTRVGNNPTDGMAGNSYSMGTRRVDRRMVDNRNSPSMLDAASRRFP